MRTLLERDGAVIPTGLPVEPDSVVLAAAEVFGTRLHPARERAVSGTTPSICTTTATTSP